MGNDLSAGIADMQKNQMCESVTSNYPRKRGGETRHLCKMEGDYVRLNTRELLDQGFLLPENLGKFEIIRVYLPVGWSAEWGCRDERQCEIIDEEHRVRYSQVIDSYKAATMKAHDLRLWEPPSANDAAFKKLRDMLFGMRLNMQQISGIEYRTWHEIEGRWKRIMDLVKEYPELQEHLPPKPENPQPDRDYNGRLIGTTAF